MKVVLLMRRHAQFEVRHAVAGFPSVCPTMRSRPLVDRKDILIERGGLDILCSVKQNVVCEGQPHVIK